MSIRSEVGQELPLGIYEFNILRTSVISTKTD